MKSYLIECAEINYFTIEVDEQNEDESIGDYTAIDHLFRDISKDDLEGFLSEVINNGGELA